MYNFDRRNQKEDKVLEGVNKDNIITQWNELNVLPIYKTIPQNSQMIVASNSV